MKKVYEIASGKKSELRLDVSKHENILIKVGINCDVTLFETTHEGPTSKRSDPKSARLVVVAERGARVSWFVENMNGGIKVDRTVKVGSGAKINYVEQNLGFFGARTKFLANLIGKKSIVNVSTLVVLNDGNKSQHEIEINHLARETYSAFTGYALLQDKAEHAWEIRTVIENIAKKSVASQRINNLLLGDDGVVKNHPALIIRNNDVSCTHSVATGHLNKEQLFYSRARGLTIDQSKNLMARGFVEPFIRLLPKNIQQEIVGKLDQGRSLVSGA